MSQGVESFKGWGKDRWFGALEGILFGDILRGLSQNLKGRDEKWQF